MRAVHSGPVSKAEFECITRAIQRTDFSEDVSLENLDCSTGTCPIESSQVSDVRGRYCYVGSSAARLVRRRPRSADSVTYAQVARRTKASGARRVVPLPRPLSLLRTHSVHLRKEIH